MSQQEPDSVSQRDPFQVLPTMRRVERVAWSTISKCLKAEGLQTLRLPIPVDRWIEGPLGFRLGSADLSYLGREVLGAAFIQEREVVISSLLDGQDARWRFTAAHELGHMLLHAKRGASFVDQAGFDAEATRQVEREANRFAAALLLPAPVFGAVLSERCGSLGAAPGEILDRVNRGDGPAVRFFQERVVRWLAERFGTASSTTLIRFSELERPGWGPALDRQVVDSLLAQRH